jgi:HEAT repeat protein
VRNLSDPDSNVRGNARRYFDEHPPEAYASVLLKLLNEDDEEIRKGAVLAMTKCGSKRRDLTPALLESLAKDVSDSVRSLCTSALSQVGAEDPAALKGLMRALVKDRAALVRRNAVRGIRQMHIWPNGSLALLARGLDDDNVSVRVETAYALVEKEHAKTAIPMLFEALIGKEEREIAWIADAMSFAGEGRSLLEERITSKRCEFRAGAILAISKMGKRDKPSMEKLRKSLGMALKLLKDEDALVRRSASLALMPMVDERSGEIVPEIVDALHDLDEDVRSACCDLLGSIGPSAKASVPELIRSLDDQAAHVRGQAAKALGDIGPVAIEAVPRLIDLLRNDKATTVRWRAADGLGGIGRGAEAAVPALLEVLNDEDEELSRRARGALERIRSNKE